MEDLEKPSQVCKMCESAAVRYVHYMRHPEYPETLGVGCICTERMENEAQGAAAARAGPAADVGAAPAADLARGNFHLRTEGFFLTVFRVSDPKDQHFWRIRVTNGLSAASQVGRRRYPTADEAKRAALDALLWAKDKLP